MLDWLNVELDRRCIGYIRDHIDSGVIHHVDNESTVIGCWNKLQGLYERKTATHKVGLVRQLSRLRYEDGQLITEHLNQLEHLFNQLTTIGVSFTDEVQVLWLLGTLPESWETPCISLSTSSPDGTIKKDVVINAILNKNLRRSIGNVCYPSEEDEWVIDSGASLNVTPHKIFFSSYELGDYGVAKMGNNGVSEIVAVGDVH
ncbi:hypothetical protein LIER_27451 [Lithospermum erythrorhizon]|uniref:Retrovirus-related Pol polyprotein from transposon TNT 1-94-like beta-barrel domain-containing protein n=1 Tax=Lithospermum erythrorhizon TaxID=34254 RepID=A0AAV3RF34_LITER